MVLLTCKKISSNALLDNYFRFQRRGIRYPRRFAFALLFGLLNLCIAVWVTASKIAKPRKSVTHVLLLILASNLCLYICYYVFRKNQRRCGEMFDAYCRQDDAVDARARYSVRIGRRSVPCPINPGEILHKEHG